MRQRFYRVDPADGSGIKWIPMANVGTHADVRYVDHPGRAPECFRPHLPTLWVWSIILVDREISLD